MAIVPRGPGQVARRIVGYSFLADVVASGLIYLAISHVVGLVIFLIGLVLTGLAYLNLRQVMRTKGMRW